LDFDLVGLVGHHQQLEEYQVWGQGGGRGGGLQGTEREK